MDHAVGSNLGIPANDRLLQGTRAGGGSPGRTAKGNRPSGTRALHQQERQDGAFASTHEIWCGTEWGYCSMWRRELLV